LERYSHQTGCRRPREARGTYRTSVRATGRSGACCTAARSVIRALTMPRGCGPVRNPAARSARPCGPRWLPMRFPGRRLRREQGGLQHPPLQYQVVWADRSVLADQMGPDPRIWRGTAAPALPDKVAVTFPALAPDCGGTCRERVDRNGSRDGTVSRRVLNPPSSYTHQNPGVPWTGMASDMGPFPVRSSIIRPPCPPKSGVPFPARQKAGACNAIKNVDFYTPSQTNVDSNVFSAAQRRSGKQLVSAASSQARPGTHSRCRARSILSRMPRHLRMKGTGDMEVLQDLVLPAPAVTPVETFRTQFSTSESTLISTPRHKPTLIPTFFPQPSVVQGSNWSARRPARPGLEPIRGAEPDPFCLECLAISE
jgi:hypothetical protein